MQPIVAFFDGLTESLGPGMPRNPGGCACGGYVVRAHPDVPVLTHDVTGWKIYGHGTGFTNNQAEYQAALDALRAVYKTGWRGPVILRGDSQLVVKQTTGEWACNKPHLSAMRDMLRGGMSHFERVTLEWVPRDQNGDADYQSRLAWDSACRMYGEPGWPEKVTA